MGHRDLLRGWRGRAAITALTLIILAAGLCYFDRDQDGMDDHAMLQDLCFLALQVPPLILLLVGLFDAGLALDLRVPIFAAVPLPVPKPPPRRAPFTSIPERLTSSR
jgi:hypothetical protein